MQTTGSDTESRSARLEHLAVLAVFAAFVVWYVRDCVRASPTIDNLLLIVPAGGAAAVLLAVVAFRILNDARRARRAVHGPLANTVDGRWSRKTLSVIVAFAIYIAALPFAGFDVATFLFVGGVLVALGERRPLVAGGFALAVAVALSAAALATLSSPLPTAFAGRLWHLL